jgi:hypothetical protein
MNTFDDREKAAERKYVLDEELAFKATARRNKLLGLWAADRLGKKATDAERYAQEIVMASLEGKRHGKVIEKLMKDLKLTEKDIQAEMERLMPLARQQIIGRK